MFVAVDIGSTNAKACLISRDGQPVALIRSEYPRRNSRASPYESYEVALNIISDLLSNNRYSKDDIEGLVFSARNDGGATVALDEKDQPIQLSVNTDEIIEIQTQLVNELFPQYIQELLGVLGITPLLKWLQTKGRGQYNNIGKLMGVKDYAIFKMSGAFVCDTLDRGYLRTPVTFCEKRGIIEDAENILPEVVPPTKIVGWLKPELARRLNLREGLPICVGSRDGNCANVGCGTVELGQACTTLATYGVIRLVWDKPILDLPLNRLSPRLHAIPGQWLIDSTPGGGAMALRWFRDNFAHLETVTANLTGLDVYDLLDNEAELAISQPKGLLFLPYMTGMSAPIKERRAGGILFGINLDHTRGDIIKAIMAGVVYTLRSGMEIIENSGAKVTELRVTGGGAKAKLWNQLQADIMKRPVLKSDVEEVECLGASILLAAGLGAVNSVKEGVSNMVRIKETYRPRKEVEVFYNDQYQLFRDICLSIYSNKL